MQQLLESEFFESPGFFNTSGVTLEYTKWGYKDATPLLPESRYSEEFFNREIFNIVFHMRQPLTEVMKWTYKERKTMWQLYLEQREFDAENSKKGLSA